MPLHIKRTLLTAAVLLLIALPGISRGRQRPSGVISGIILDQETRAPISGAVALVRETGLDIRSDEQGRFRLGPLVPGTYSLCARAEGYTETIIADLILEAGSRLQIEVLLVPSLPKIREEVTVTAKSRPRSQEEAGSVHRMESEQITRVPGSLKDVSRVLQVAPGVSHMTQKSNDLIVRGGSPWENGFYIDNIPVPNVNHFQSQATSGGVIGVIDSSLIRDVEFHTGGFASLYGSRMSSVVDIRFREGDRNHRQTWLDLNITGFGARMEGPLGKGRGSWILGAKRSYHDLAAKAVGLGIAPRFGDAHLKIAYDIGSRHRITLLNIYGDSRITYDLEHAVERGFNTDLDFSTRQNTLGVNWQAGWSDRLFSETSVSYSFFKNFYSADAVEPGSASRDYRVTEEFSGTANLRNVNSLKLSERTLLEFGAEYRWERLDYSNYASEYMNRWGSLMAEALARGRISAGVGAAYMTWIWRPLEQLTTSLGARAEYFSLNRHWMLAPRLSANLQLTPRLSFRGAWGYYYQTLPLFLLSGHPENRGNQDPRAEHIVLGLRYAPSEDVICSLEAFNKSYTHLPLASEDPSRFVLDSGLDFGFFRSYNQLLDSGAATCRGLELLVRKRTLDNLYGLLSVSLFRSRFKDLGGVWRNRINDNQYLLTLLAGYRPNDRWNLSLRLSLAGGIPYTPYDEERSAFFNRGILDQEHVLARRYPSYLSLDLRGERRFALGNGWLDVYLGVMNILNRKNVERYFWDMVDNQVGVIHQAPILPVFGLAWTF